MSGKPLVPSKDALRAFRCLALSPSAAYLGAAGALCGAATLHYQANRKVRLAETIVERKRKLHSISNGSGAARIALMFEAAENGQDFTIKKPHPPKTPRRRHSSTVAVHRTLDAEEVPDDTAVTSVEGAGIDNRATRTLARVQDPLREAALTTGPSSQWQPLDSIFRSTTESPVSDLSPLLRVRNSSTPYRTESDSSRLDLNTYQSTGANAFSLMQPWKMDDDGNESPKDKRLGQEPIEHIRIPKPDLYIDMASPQPTSLQNPEDESRYDFTIPSVELEMVDVGIARYCYVFGALRDHQRKHGKQEALILLEQTLRSYIMTGKGADWAFAQALFLDCLSHLYGPEIRSMVRRIVEDFLAGDNPRLEVVRLLYPGCGARPRPGESRYYFFACQYLEDIVNKGVGPDRYIAELRKIIAGTQQCEIGLHEHLFVPVLRSLCKDGRVSQAQALYDEMEFDHEILFSFYAMQELVKGYAMADNWTKVESILDHCHRRQLSHQKPYGSSALLISVLDQHAAKRSLDETYNFVKHCIKKYGLQPISGVTKTMVKLALRQRRYDVVEDWIKMVLIKFPHIDTGTTTPAFALEVSEVWRETKASCEDIYHGCRAIAIHALRDPFSTAFRGSAAAAVSASMQMHLTDLRKIVGSDVPLVVEGGVQQFRGALMALKDSTAVRVGGSRAQLLLSDLLSQCRTLQALNALFRGDVRAQERLTRRAKVRKPLVCEAPAAISLPHLSQITEDLLAQYLQREKSGDSVDHDNLRRVVVLLEQNNRSSEAASLIESIYNTRWAQPSTGREFDLDLFATWAKHARQVKSGQKLRSALWAILDSSPQLKLDSQIILLARVAAPKTHIRMQKSARDYEVEEVEYLRDRLKRRHWITSESKTGLYFNTWDGFSRSRAVT